ncbi:MAG: hypothetical protein HQL66_00720 [Magnetococcales bacterium]|nr:hypothetical protein [Magnetococcales bacterium]
MTATAGVPYYYKGNGRLYFRPYATPSAPLIRLANVKELKVSIKEKTETLPDYDDPAGGVAAMASRIEDAQIDLIIHDIQAPNLALALWGSATDVAGTSVNDEAVSVYKGSLTCLARAGATAVVVKSSDGTTTYAAGTDYQVTGAGLLIPATSSIADGASLKVSYTYPAQHQVEAMTGTGQEVFLVCDGLNLAGNGRPRVVRLWRAKLKPAKEVDYINTDKFTELALSGSLLRDETRGDGLSKYFSETIVTA